MSYFLIILKENQLEKLFSALSETLKLFVNILTPDDKYYLSKSQSLTQPIQMQLSLNQKIFCQFFSAFPEATQFLGYFEKMMSLRGCFFSKIIDWKKRGYLNTQKAPSQNTYGQSIR